MSADEGRDDMLDNERVKSREKWSAAVSAEQEVVLVVRRGKRIQELKLELMVQPSSISDRLSDGIADFNSAIGHRYSVPDFWYQWPSPVDGLLTRSVLPYTTPQSKGVQDCRLPASGSLSIEH